MLKLRNVGTFDVDEWWIGIHNAGIDQMFHLPEKSATEHIAS